MSALQICWIAVAACTVIFLIVAAISALPKMKAVYTAGVAAVVLGASAITAFGSIAPVLAALAPPGLAAPYKLPAAPVPGAPLANDASAGHVVFTFDDGPDIHTGQVIAELNALHLHGVFFVIGGKAAAHPELIRAEMANGEVIGNHTWDHKSFTGKGTGTKPLSQAQVRDELSRADAAIVTAGAPEPTLWRPPYGAVNTADEKTAQSLGLRVVLDSGTNIIDSNDWAGLNAQQIAARVEPRLRDGTIIAFHDGLTTAKPATVAALPLIVAYMNAHHLGATTTIRADATGGVVPYLAPARASAPATPGTSAPAAVTAPRTGQPAATTPATTRNPGPAPATSAPGTRRPSPGTPAPTQTTRPTPTPTPTPTQTPTPAPTPSATDPPAASTSAPATGSTPQATTASTP